MRGGAFAAALAADRGRFNALYEAARRASPALDAGEFAAHLRGPVAALVNGVAASYPDRAPAAAAALYEASLDLFRKDLLGGRSRNPLLPRVWAELLPLGLRFLAADPAGFAACMLNALHNISAEAPAAAGLWLRRMCAVLPSCSAPEEPGLCGQVLAWRCGLPQYRASALKVWEQLPEDLQLLTLGLDPQAHSGQAAAIGARLRADRWYRPGGSGKKEIRVVSACGGFRGLGGPFAVPPALSVRGGAVVAADGAGNWVLHSDDCGSVFRRAAPGDLGSPAPNDPANSISRKGEIAFGGLRASSGDLAGCASYASTGDLLAVALKESHYVYVIAPAAADQERG